MKTHDTFYSGRCFLFTLFSWIHRLFSFLFYINLFDLRIN
ncbi:hypothetical protein HMPREF3214_00447 [Alloscardovia omnicolens]|nr:hypothetical protein HMPREF3214_00447 [Alloscardovia omnicolens]